MADQVAGLLDADDPVALVGHSLGGKVAMVLALRHPELVARLCVVDVSPVAYDSLSQFAGYVAAMQGLDLGSLAQRSDADTALAESVPDPTVRSFLLQNLRRDGDRWRWQMNLDVLGADLAVIGSWPEDRLAGVPPYDGPVLWMAGARSDYIAPAYAEAMDRWFPRNRLVTVKDAGHWVHSEQQDVFLRCCGGSSTADAGVRVSVSGTARMAPGRASVHAQAERVTGRVEEDAERRARLVLVLGRTELQHRRLRGVEVVDDHVDVHLLRDLLSRPLRVRGEVADLLELRASRRSRLGRRPTGVAVLGDLPVEQGAVEVGEGLRVGAVEDDDGKACDSHGRDSRSHSGRLASGCSADVPELPGQGLAERRRAPAEQVAQDPAAGR